MNRPWRTRGAILAAAILCCFDLVSPARAADTGTIRVTILHSDGSPLEEALVTLHREIDGPILGQASTCEDGQALFEDLEPATYAVRAAKAEYRTIDIPGIEVPGGRRTWVPITLRLANTKYSACGLRVGPHVEPRPGSVRVEVREIDGGPIQDAQVTLHARRDGPALQEARSGEDGVVLFENVGWGVYVIRAAQSGYRSRVIPEVHVAEGYRFPLRLALRRVDSPVPCGPQPVAR